MQLFSEHQWHHLSAQETVKLTKSDSTEGLDEIEAQKRLAKYGLNKIAARKAEHPFIRFLRQFHQPLIYILIGSGLITALLGEWIDSAVIFAVVLVNASLGYFQEAKAINALTALAKTMISEATVVRDGQKIHISSVAVVPGDIVMLQAGNKIPADIRLLTVQGLQIDESALTGESVPVDKSTALLATETELADRNNMAYASTLVTHGQGKGIIVTTGDLTEVGKISKLISSAQELATPLTQKISRFSKLLLYVILFLAALTVMVGLYRGIPLFDMFMAAVALAVGAIPEGLPAAVTITLAIGVSRMAQRKAIIRRLPAVETLGSTTVICSDKTGTLTENKMTVQTIIAGDQHFKVTGSGYNPLQGNVLHNNQPVVISQYQALKECLVAGILCNDSLLAQDDSEWIVRGDPTEGALLVSAAKAGVQYTEIQKKYRLLDSIPFASHNQYMASLFLHRQNQCKTLYIKGSFEVVVSACRSQMNGRGERIELDRKNLFEHAERLASQGLRVLAFASTSYPDDTESLDQKNVLSDLVFLGLQGMIDPPRQEAKQAVHVCHEAGVAVKMITGDHALTAQAIARRLGIGGGEHALSDTSKSAILTGKQLESLSDQEMIEAVKKTDIFARTTPEQKLRLVKALQSQNQIVAMTGDGVNDAPALKQANIGVAMGMSGTEVAKEASDMVLTDDNFSSIKAAVEEGRGVYDNLIKFIAWALPTNIGEGLVILTAIFLGITLPILPVQILWINMTTAGFLGLMLAFEPKEKGIMQRPPRDPATPIMTGVVTARILFVSLLLVIFTFLLFKIELNHGENINQARTVAVNTFVMIELFYLFNCRSMSRSFFALNIFSNLWVIGGAGTMLLIQLLYTYMPVMNKLFQSAPISFRSWLGILLSGILVSFLVEVDKWVRRIHLFSRRQS